MPTNFKPRKHEKDYTSDKRNIFKVSNSGWGIHYIQKHKKKELLHTFFINNKSQKTVEQHF